MTEITSFDAPGQGVAIRGQRRRLGPHLRILVCLLAGVALAIVLPAELRGRTRSLVGWNAATLLFMGWTIWLSHISRYPLRDVVLISDQGRLVTLAASIGAAAISLGAVIAELMFVKQDSGVLLPEHIALTITTVLATWAFAHFKFAVHNANQYFNCNLAAHGATPHSGGGLEFPGETEKLALSDFLYFSFVIGLAGSTADINISSRSIRMTALMHGVFGFFFNMTVLGLTVNLVSGLF